jgi:hypothetical protein
MRLRTLLLFVVSVLLGGVVGGCGTGSGSSSTDGAKEAGGPTGMAGYVAAADAICTAENERLAAPAADLESTMLEAQKSGELAGAATSLRKFRGEIMNGLGRLESLEPPAAERGEVEAVIATQANQVSLFGDLARAYDAEDRTASQKVETRLADSKKRYGKQTAALGFKVCGARSR